MVSRILYPERLSCCGKQSNDASSCERRWAVAAELRTAGHLPAYVADVTQRIVEISHSSLLYIAKLLWANKYSSYLAHLHVIDSTVVCRSWILFVMDDTVITFKPHPDASQRKRSAIALIKLLLRVDKPEVLPKHLEELIDKMLWKITEADGEYNTRYRSDRALRCANTKLLAHEHVFPKKTMIKRLTMATLRRI